MENETNKKSNKGLVIGLIIGGSIFLILIAVGIFFAYKIFIATPNKIIDNIDKSSEIIDKAKETVEDIKDNNSSNTTDSTNSSNSSINVTTKDSSKESPLSINEWGKASKYVSKHLSTEYENVSYVDVPVRVTKVTRGDEAVDIIKKYIESQSYYKYTEPKANTEWVVFDYQVDLNGLTFDEGTIGTDTRISSSIKGLDGYSVKYNDISYILSTTDISSRDYVKQKGIYDGKFITTLPIGCKDYLVILGNSYEGSQSYFKVE